MTFALVLGGFAACTAVIFFAGGRLAHYGDQIAELRGWGSAWVGLILMASVTSLPELVVGVSSSALVGAPDLAAGDVLGSCAFNLMLLGAMDAFVSERRPLFGVASSSHVVAGALSIILLALVGVAFVADGSIVLLPWIGLSSILFIGVYLVALRVMYRHARAGVLDDSGEEADATEPPSLRRVATRYALYAAIIVGAALALPPLARELAVLTGLGESFVGTVFLALSTSLPEVAVSYAAVRMGSIDLAVGSLLGSNLFNILILAIDDVAYTEGLLLQDASPAHLTSALAAIIMTAIAIIGLSIQSSAKRFWLAWDAALILGVYVLNASLLLAS